MSDSWITKFKGTIEGFPVEVQIYSDGGELRVVTVQPETLTTRGSTDEGSIIFPYVINKGDCIHLDGATEQELLQELISFGFSQAAAEQVIAHTRS